MAEAKPAPRKFVRENIKREQTNEDNKIYVSANTWMSRIISQVEQAFNEKNLAEVVVRGLGRGAELVMRARIVIQRIIGCHAVVKNELFNSDVKYVCEEDKTEVTIKQSSICVEITFSKEAPKDTSIAGYFAPLTDVQKEVLAPRGDRRDRRRRRGGRYYERRRPQRQPREEKKEEKGEKKEEKKEEKPRQERERRQGGNYRRSGPKGYGRYRNNYGNK